MRRTLQLHGRLVSARVKNVYRDTITIAGGSTSNTKTIAKVDVYNSRVRFLGCSTNDGTSSEGRVGLTNETTVTATRAGNTNSTVVSFEVTEYWPGVIKSVQRGVITVGAGAGSGTATLSPEVDITKTEVDCLGDTTADGGAPTNQDNNGRLTLTDKATVTATHGGTFDWSMGWQVTELY